MKKNILFVLLTFTILISSKAYAYDIPEAAISYHTYTFTKATTINDEILFYSNSKLKGANEHINVFENNYISYNSTYFGSSKIEFSDTYDFSVVESSYNLDSENEFSKFIDISTYNYVYYRLAVVVTIPSGSNESETTINFMNNQDITSMLITKGIILDKNIIEQAYQEGFIDGQDVAYNDYLEQIENLENNSYNQGFEDAKNQVLDNVYTYGIDAYGYNQLSSYDYNEGLNNSGALDLDVLSFMPSLLGAGLGYILSIGSIPFMGITVNSIIIMLAIFAGAMFILKLIFGGK